MNIREYLERERQGALDALLRIHKRWWITKRRKKFLMKPLVARYAKYDEYLDRLAENQRLRDRTDDYRRRKTVWASSQVAVELVGKDVDEVTAVAYDGVELTRKVDS